MDDLRARFASLDAIAVPDLRPEIDRRVAALPRSADIRVVASGLTWRAARAPRLAGVPALVVLAAVVSALLVTAVGMGWLRPVVTVPPSNAPTGPTSAPSPTVAEQPFVFYAVFDELLFSSSSWVMRADGTETHQLADGSPIGPFTPDGRSILGFGPNGLALWEVVGAEPAFIEHPLPQCQLAGCLGGRGHVLSPDGTRLAFVAAPEFNPPVGSDANYGPSVIAIFDLATGHVTRLESTATDWPNGANNGPSWSPDGKRLAFTRGDAWDRWPPVKGDREQSMVFVVNDDGTDLQEIVTRGLFPRGASWSPDGSRISFTTYDEWRQIDSGDIEDVRARSDRDIFTVRLDGADRQRITSDTTGSHDHRDSEILGAMAFSWTSESRIIFRRYLADGSVELWVMDADGQNQQRLDVTDVAGLTAAGCVVCPYPVIDRRTGPIAAYWQPDPSVQP